MNLKKNVTIKRIIGRIACVAAGLIVLIAPFTAVAQELKESISPFPPVVEGWTPYAESIKFSEDFTRMAYAARRDKGLAVIVDGKPGPVYEAIGQDTPVFSPDSRRVAYKAKKGGTWYLVVDGREYPPYEAISLPRFSRKDSSHVIYIGKKGAKQCLVADGR